MSKYDNVMLPFETEIEIDNAIINISDLPILNFKGGNRNLKVTIIKCYKSNNGVSIEYASMVNRSSNEYSSTSTMSLDRFKVVLSEWDSVSLLSS